MKRVRTFAPNKRSRKVAVAGGLKAGRFLDYVLEMYAPPSSITFRKVVNGRAGIAQDKARIREYYRIASENALGRKE